MYSILHFFARKKNRINLNARYNLVQSIVRSSGILLVLFALHIAFMMVFENFSFGDSLWLTLTTATTVGYGDISASTLPGRMATVILLYLGGIFILAKVAGDYFDYRLEVRDKKKRGHWSWKMDKHIVILNTPDNSGERYLQRLIKQFRASSYSEETPIYLLTRHFPDGLPDYIVRLGNVVHYHGDSGNIDDLNEVCVTQAQDVIVLTKDENDDTSDARTFDILHRLKELNIQAKVLAECVEDKNRQRLQTARANIVLRPIRAYPEMIVRAFDAPGSEQIIENMFTSEDDGYQRYDVSIKNLAWSEIVTRLITNNAGIAVAYIDEQNDKMIYNPPAQTKPDIKALITICKDTARYSNDDIQALILD